MHNPSVGVSDRDPAFIGVRVGVYKAVARYVRESAVLPCLQALYHRVKDADYERVSAPRPTNAAYVLAARRFLTPGEALCRK